MAKRPIIQTIFKEEQSIEDLQEWANEFLKTHEAVNLQVCKSEEGSLQMMIVYKDEIQIYDSSTPSIEEGTEIK